MKAIIGHGRSDLCGRRDEGIRLTRLWVVRMFICSPGRPPRVVAVKKRPTDYTDEIFHAPLLNIFYDGRSCPGTHKYPDNIADIPEDFFLSFFSRGGNPQRRSQKHPDNLLALWEELDGQKRYPLGDLVKAGTIGDLMK